MAQASTTRVKPWHSTRRPDIRSRLNLPGGIPDRSGSRRIQARSGIERPAGRGCVTCHLPHVTRGKRGDGRLPRYPVAEAPREQGEIETIDETAAIDVGVGGVSRLPEGAAER